MSGGFHKKIVDFFGTKEAYSTYLALAWPCVLEALLLCAVNMVDTLMVSGLGEEAIAAVGITSQPKFVLLAAVFAFNGGITAVIARRKGEERQEASNAILKGVLVVGLGLGLLISAIGIFGGRGLILLAGAEDAYLQQAVDYFMILSSGFVFQTLNLVINAAQRGSGRTRITMQTNLIANLVNIFCNYLLIYGNLGFPKMGVAGAALATTIGAVVACTVAVITLLQRSGYLNLYLMKAQVFSLRLLQPVFRIAGSAFVEQIFMRIGFFLYAMIVANLGTTPYATHLICMSLLNLSFSFGDGISVAAATLVGQRLGAGSVPEAKLYAKVGQRVALVASTFVALLFFFGRNSLIELYSDDPEIIAMGAVIMVIMALSTHVQTAQLVYNGCLRGAGDAKYVALTSLVSIGILRPLIAYILCMYTPLGVYGAWASLFIDLVIRTVLSGHRFKSGKWSEVVL